MTSAFLADLQWRGLLHQVTHADRAHGALARPGTSAYIGFDPTAASLHVGSLLPITALMRLRQHGLHPIAVVGDGTGLIGDPSGKTAERKLLDAPDVAANSAAIEAQLRSLFGHVGLEPPTFVRNGDWLGGLPLVAFLRDVGKYFSVNTMIQRDSVKARLEQRDQGISYTEFSYMLLQAFDFLELWRRAGCVGQLGGSDQWGNIVAGVDLIERLEPASAAPDRAPFGVTMPLVTTRAGHKFGKTEAGTVWLDAARTTPWQFLQFWLDADDDSALLWLGFFTLLPQPDIEAVRARHALAPHERHAQKTLAHAVTAMVHGPVATDEAEACARIVFGGDPRTASADLFAALAAALPSRTVAPDTDATLATCVGGDGGLFASNGDLRRALQAGGVQWNGERLGADDLFRPLAAARWLHGQWALVRFGKRPFVVRRGPA